MQDDLQQHAPNPYKQLRPLKSPLYVPAALRPTEHFYTPSPMTPPKSLHESLDTLETSETQTGSPEQQQHLDLESYDPDWIQEADLGEVTGPPTKDHWKVRCCKQAPTARIWSSLKGVVRTSAADVSDNLNVHAFYKKPC
jgi:hypothetical protein